MTGPEIRRRNNYLFDLLSKEKGKKCYYGLSTAIQQTLLLCAATVPVQLGPLWINEDQFDLIWAWIDWGTVGSLILVYFFLFPPPPSFS